MVRRSQRTKGQQEEQRSQSPAVGIRRYFADAAGAPGGKMAPTERQAAAARGAGDALPHSSPPSPSGSGRHGTAVRDMDPSLCRYQGTQLSGEAVALGGAGAGSSPPSSPAHYLGSSPGVSPAHNNDSSSLLLPINPSTAAMGNLPCERSFAEATTGLSNAIRSSPSSSPTHEGRNVSQTALSKHVSMLPIPSTQGTDLSDLKLQLAAIPTKLDMEGYIQRLESVYKSEIQALTANLSQVSDRLQRLDGDVAAISTHQVTQDRAIAQNTQHIHMLYAIAEDHENRNRRNNLRIRGIPETVSTTNILPTLKKLFNDLLGEPETSQIEIDRAHRTLGPKSSDPNRPRDILCRLHYFTIKELILRKARDKGDIYLADCKIQLLSDLSKMTLDKRRALRPLLDALREHEITYSWGYPFQLQVRADGNLFCVRTPADVPEFCTALRMPVAHIRDWPYTPLPPQRSQQRRRGRSPPSPQGRPRGDRPERPR